MSNTINLITPCQYLFGNDQPAEKVFPGRNITSVNESLSTLMQAIDHLVVSKPESLIFFDPAAFNDQCHLYALMVAQVVTQTKIQTIVSSIIKTNENKALPEGINNLIHGYCCKVDRRFLYLSFFLSKVFRTGRELLDKVIYKHLKSMKVEPSRKFRQFLQIPGTESIHVARTALNILFEDYMKSVLTAGEGPLYPELLSVANENLQLVPSYKQGTLYTYPKFAGVAYFIDALAKENIPLLFKVKVMTKEGSGSFSYSNQDFTILDPATPVVVFEMIATGDSLTYLECDQMARKCPTYFFHNISKQERHKVTETCLFCTPKTVDVAPYKQKFVPALEQSNHMLLALGADFVQQNQKSFVTFFADRVKYPKLTTLFAESIPTIHKFFLSMSKALNMSVDHVYADCASEAMKSTLLMNATYLQHLRTRGI